MRRSRVVVACSECGEFWDDGAAAPRCADPGHAHQRFELHVHHTPVTLPGGAEVIATSFDPQDPYGRDDLPDYGLYLDPRWDPSWPHDYVRWPDLGVPDDAGDLCGKLRSLLERARAGERVEVGCLGGHGRTGTALALLASLDGIPGPEAVTWVRERYCPKAVETSDQEALVREVAGPAGA